MTSPNGIKKTPDIQKIETEKLNWINVSKITSAEIGYLRENFKFHSFHLEECLSKTQRSKFSITSKYFFTALLFPIYNRRTRKIISSEVDFFIGPNYLITVHRKELPPLINFFNTCQISESEQKKYLTDSPMTLLYEILDRLLSYCLPIMDNLNLNVNNIEECIFKGYEKRMVREILIVKTNIISFRRIMRAHQAIIHKLLKKSSLFFPSDQLTVLFENLIDNADDIWQNLENINETIEATERTNSSLISFHLNDIIKILTTISVIVLPITLLTNIFGMNLKYIPLGNNPLSFWFIIGLMSLNFIITIYLFKKKKWL